MNHENRYKQYKNYASEEGKREPFSKTNQQNKIDTNKSPNTHSHKNSGSAGKNGGNKQSPTGNKKNQEE